MGSHNLAYDPSDPFIFIRFKKAFFQRLYVHWALLTTEIFILGYLRFIGNLGVWTMVGNDVLNTITNIFGTIVSFYLVFVTRMVFDRWWSMRNILGIMMGSCNNIGMLAAEYIEGDEEVAQNVRAKLLRYMNLAHALVYQTVKRKADLDRLVDEDLLDLQEMELLEPIVMNRFVVAYRWASGTLVEAYKRKLILSDRWVVEIQSNISRARGAAADTTMYMNTPVPFPYIQQLYWCLMVFVYLNIPLLTLKEDFWCCGPESLHGVCLLWPTFLALIVASAFLGLREVAVELQDPFGEDDVDFPTDSYLDSTKSNTGTIIGQHLKLSYEGWNFNKWKNNLGENRDMDLTSG